MTTTPPRISCVILCHNYGRYLDRAITSCLDQEPGDYVLHEILVIDDGSTDETQEVCRRHRDRVRIVRRDRQGFGPTLTDAFLLTGGDWVAPLDADDWFHPAKLRTCAEAITGGRLFIEHWEYVVDAEGRPLIPEPHAGGNTSTLLVQREAALTLLPATNEIFFHALREAGHGHVLPAPLVHYRVHPHNMTDRRTPGVSQHYRADVCSALGHRLRAMATAPPDWASASTLRRMSHRFHAQAAGHRVEAQLQVGSRRASLRPLAAMLARTIRSGAAAGPWFTALTSAATGRPQAPLPKIKNAEAGDTESDHSNTGA
ncbi:glycosyltransferase [Streptomyces sp. NBC_01433]|uniref:glycosyltransferase family 2 protein n=1 Tax=Streptomyces sp. NBC_01433 TaxID=2903864 RepID=UPI0022548153|nr:glycosyltransferase [Streptomyces sp. NBC_01433]MCX4675576.1 glycosyltransferase [Streptomyces sp. NBC_01433]